MSDTDTNTEDRYAPGGVRDGVSYLLIALALVVADMLGVSVAWWFWGGGLFWGAANELTKWRMRRLAREYERKMASLRQAIASQG